MIAPFYGGGTRRDADEDRERRFQQLEYWASLLGGSVSEQLAALEEQIPRVPGDTITEAPPSSATSSEVVVGTVTIGVDDTYTELDTTPGPLTAFLPSAGSATGPLYLKVVGPAQATIQPVEGEDIDGEDRLVLARQWTAVMLVSNGANWRIFGMYLPQETLAPLLWAILLEQRKQTLHLLALSDEEVTDADVSEEV